jgi:hypothetical protein
MWRAIAVALVCVCAAGIAQAVDATQPPAAGVETLKVGTPLPRFNLLRPSARLYLRYKIVGEQRSTVDIWRRQVSFEKRDGRRQMHITWRWDSVGDQKFSRSADYWFDDQTFRPLTVERRLTKDDGTTTVSGFRYLPERVVGMADLPNNSAKDFAQITDAPMFNFEADMELFQTLALRRGYKVSIPFYEAGPGHGTPDHYTYSIVGEAKISAPDGRPLDCWIMRTESSNPKWGPTRFWLSKTTQVVIREETTLADGSIFVKMLLLGDSAIDDVGAPT